MRAIRQAISSRDAAFRRLLTLSLAVSGIVFGLLSMHTLNPTGDAPFEPAAGFVAVAHDTSTMPADAGSQSCDSDCGPIGHEMLTIALCVFALLASLLTVAAGIASWRQRSGPGSGSAVARLAEVLRAVAVTPAPPSLHVLSISRT